MLYRAKMSLETEFTANIVKTDSQGCFFSHTVVESWLERKIYQPSSCQGSNQDRSCLEQAEYWSNVLRSIRVIKVVNK